ncbi:SDR family NAD(P)-dependent oxidoreductase [Cystobacter fuscus]
MDKATGVALVTGGNRGLGFEVCRQLGQRGMRVLLSARDIAEGAKATAALREEGLEVSFEPLDVTSEESVAQLTDRLARQELRLAALVNNAGIALEGFNAEVVERTLAVNFTGALRVTEHLLPLMREHGRIVMVSSGLGALEGLPPALRQRIDPPPPRTRWSPGWTSSPPRCAPASTSRRAGRARPTASRSWDSTRLPGCSPRS